MTDVEWMTHLVKLFGWMSPGEVRSWLGFLQEVNPPAAVFALLTNPLYEAEKQLKTAMQPVIVEAELTARLAKEAADIVLLDDNFGSIVSAVEEGRNMYATIQKTLLFLLSTSLGEVLTIGSSTQLAYMLNLPVKNALVERTASGEERPLPGEKYYIPGSILRVAVDNTSPLAYGFEKQVDVDRNTADSIAKADGFASATVRDDRIKALLAKQGERGPQALLIGDQEGLVDLQPFEVGGNPALADALGDRAALGGQLAGIESPVEIGDRERAEAAEVVVRRMEHRSVGPSQPARRHRQVLLGRHPLPARRRHLYLHQRREHLRGRRLAPGGLRHLRCGDRPGRPAVAPAAQLRARPEGHWLS